MERIRLITWDRPAQGTEYLEQVLSYYKLAGKVEIQPLTGVPWSDVWLKTKEVALNKSGAEISEIGTTWLASLVSMDAIRPFSDVEIAQMGGWRNFAPATWESAHIGDSKQVWAIPQYADARVIYFWRDMLEKAGIDPETAFQTPQQLEITLERLQASGIPSPWSASTRSSGQMLQHIASWVWQAGGDFLSEDAREIRFMEDAAINGITAFFRLHRFVQHQAGPLDDGQASALFETRQSAVFMCGLWTLQGLEASAMPAQTLQHLGTALPPGPSFVGGSQLIIWRHIPSRFERTALQLVQHLTSEEVQRNSIRMFGNLPVRLDVLNNPLFSSNPNIQTAIASLKSGRSFIKSSLWAIVEERLLRAFGDIWDELRAEPDADVESTVRSHLEPLAERLGRTLGS